jgi:subtilisin family serine protease
MPAHDTASQAQTTTGSIAVSYDRATALSSHRLLAASEARAGGTFRKEYDYPQLGITMRVLSVPAAHISRTEAALRAQPGVRGVAAAGGRRYPLSVTSPYYTNDPYFEGFKSAQTGGDVPTFQTQPLVENANVPGQWGAHVTQLDYAFEYSQPNNGSGLQAAGALGSTAIKIAIIDTGADLTQPDLSPKVTSQRCFITNPDNTQSTSDFVTDPDGHGTNVSGIAGAASNNGFGFTGEGGASVLYEYRVNPTPDAPCFASPPSSTDDQCGAVTTDVADAIDDAVTRGVNVISMSLGGDTCGSGGTDPDSVEGAAVANAIAKNVIVVAAAGNGGGTKTTGVTAPGCDTGVIAVGATALADGQLNGANNSNGSAAAPSEYVASYSSYGSPGAAYRSNTAWGIVAPGGDPSSDTDVDDLHWINNLYTSTPSDPTDDTAQSCGADYGNTGPAAECQTQIAGTSMSTPVVAGAAALILAVNSTYHVPAQMKNLLCTTADDIGDVKEGCGRLNIYRAMATALGDTVLPSAKVRR